jgi:predicted porin
MNKKLLAIAVGAAMVAGATAATVGDEPTIYAKIHLSVDVMDNGGSGDAADGTFVSSNSSRLGIKGAVDLDGGLKAVYKYEMSTNYSSKADVAGDRNAYLGLKGGFGQVIAGRHDMPFKTIGRKSDLFGDTIGDNRAVTRLGANNLKDIDPTTAGNQSSGDDWADRRDNVIMYSNTFGAVSVDLAYAPEEDGKDNSDMGIGLGYAQGPLNVMFAYETHGKGNLDGFQSDVNNAAGTLDDSDGMMLAGKYKMDNISILAGYGEISSVDGIDGADVDVYTLGASMTSGMNTFKVQYTSGDFDGDESTITALGVDHKLGKNTTAYAVYAMVANDDFVPLGFNGTGHDTTVSNVMGEDASGFSLGLIHKF